MNAKKQNNRKLSELIALWYNLHGRTLANDKINKNLLLDFCAFLNNPPAHKITALSFVEYSKHLLDKGIKESAVNNYRLVILAFFNEMNRLEYWQGDPPMRKIKPVKIKESNQAFLRKNEIDELLNACDSYPIPKLAVVVRLCLATGAR